MTGTLWGIGIGLFGLFSLILSINGDARGIPGSLFIMAVGYGVYWLFGSYAGYRFRNPAPKPADIKPQADSPIQVDPMRATPASAEENKQAFNYLRVARAKIDDGFKARDGDEQLRHLAAASRALNQVRRLDPTVTTTTDGHTEGHDDLAAELLYYESKLHYDRGRNVHTAQSDFLKSDKTSDDIINDIDTFDKEAFKHYAKAVDPARRAVLYKPNLPLYHRHLSLVYTANHATDKAREALQKALELNPDDVETLKLMV